MQSFNSGTHQAYDVDWAVALKSRAIRSYYCENRPGDKPPAIPDCIHLATAVLLKVTELHTFDDGGKGGFSLLALDGDVAGDAISIKKPVSSTPEML